MDKKGMALQDLYGVILVLVLVAVLLGLGLTVLAKMEASAGITGTSSKAINDSITAIADIPSTWLGIIVIVVVAVIVIGLLVRNLGGSTGGR
jgi:type II secretory pathway component PulF